MKNRKQSSVIGIAAKVVIITTLALTLSLTGCPQPASGGGGEGGGEGAGGGSALSGISSEENAFGGNLLTSVTIPDNVTSIGYNAFRNASDNNYAKSVNIGANVLLSRDFFSYGDCFNDVYTTNNRKAGTYTSNGMNYSTKWNYSARR
jgi:hypothetical protein